MNNAEFKRGPSSSDFSEYFSFFIRPKKKKAMLRYSIEKKTNKQTEILRSEGISHFYFRHVKRRTEHHFGDRYDIVNDDTRK